jgi:thymidine kinase
MAKLYFRYGVVGAAKTLNLLAVRHNYEHQGKKVFLLKPDVDDRFGKANVTSRSGLTHKADGFLLEDGISSKLKKRILNANLSCILVDEAQFLSVAAVDDLRYLATHLDIPVICYGLRTDFLTRLFIGSKRLLEVSDSIEEIKNTCKMCNSKAVFSMRIDADGNPVTSGPQVLLGADDTYVPVCTHHYFTSL